jgi:hypothetical protein
MNTQAARGFVPTLRHVEQSLRAPLPERTRILRELEFDLEELQARFVTQGVEPTEARQRALDALVPDGRVLEQLDRLHESAYRRATRHLDDAFLQVAERAALAAMTAGVLGIQTVTLLRLDLLADPSPFLWPVVTVGGGMLALVLWKVFELFIKKDHEHPYRGLTGILGLCGVILGAGFGGMILDFYWLAGRLEAAPELSEPLITEWLIRDSALVAATFLFVLAGALAWLILTQWLAWVSGAHRVALGLDNLSTWPRR